MLLLRKEGYRWIWVMKAKSALAEEGRLQVDLSNEGDECSC